MALAYTIGTGAGTNGIGILIFLLMVAFIVVFIAMPIQKIHDYIDYKRRRGSSFTTRDGVTVYVGLSDEEWDLMVEERNRAGVHND